MDHSFKELRKTSSLFRQHRSPCFASAKVLLFPFPQTLFKTFFLFFSLFLLHSEKQPVTRKKNMKKGAGTPVSRQKNASYGGRTGRKTSENITNPDFLRKNRTATTRTKHTDIDRKSGEKHMKRTNGGNAASSDRTLRVEQDGRQRPLRSQRQRNTQRKSTPY